MGNPKKPKNTRAQSLDSNPRATSRKRYAQRKSPPPRTATKKNLALTSLARTLAPSISLGIDLEHVARVDQLLKQHPTKFLDRVFTPGEVAHSAGRRNRAQHLAARFACKEAVMKALGTGLTSGISWRDIEVVTLPTGKPVIKLTANAAKVADSRGISHWEISLTHTKEVAAAVAIAW
jgi:holo-[acyl-carrier protein] synthase